MDIPLCLLSLRQITDLGWIGEVSNARRRLILLGEPRLLQRITVQALTLSRVAIALVKWKQRADHACSTGIATTNASQ